MYANNHHKDGTSLFGFRTSRPSGESDSHVSEDLFQTTLRRRKGWSGSSWITSATKTLLLTCATLGNDRPQAARPPAEIRARRIGSRLTVCIEQTYQALNVSLGGNMKTLLFAFL